MIHRVPHDFRRAVNLATVVAGRFGSCASCRSALCKSIGLIVRVVVPMNASNTARVRCPAFCANVCGGGLNYPNASRLAVFPKQAFSSAAGIAEWRAEWHAVHTPDMICLRASIAPRQHRPSCKLVCCMPFTRHPESCSSCYMGSSGGLHGVACAVYCTKRSTFNRLFV